MKVSLFADDVCLTNWQWFILFYQAACLCI